MLSSHELKTLSDFAEELKILRNELLPSNRSLSVNYLRRHWIKNVGDMLSKLTKKYYNDPNALAQFKGYVEIYNRAKFIIQALG